MAPPTTLLALWAAATAGVVVEALQVGTTTRSLERTTRALSATSTPHDGGHQVVAAAVATATTQAEMEAQFARSVQSTYGRYPVTITSGSGCELRDDLNERSYLDFVAGIATCCLGHADARLVDAVATQMKSVTHASNLYYIPQQGALAEWLAATLASDDGASSYRAFFCNSGGEANEAALKLAFKYAATRRDAPPNNDTDDWIVLTARGSFHGRTMATISATAQPKYHGPGACWKIDRFAHFDFNDPDSARQVFEEYRGRIAAVLIEPVQGEGGVRVGDPAFFRTLRELCDAEGALLMFDEVQAGVGRTGRMWAHEHLFGGAHTGAPDVVTCAKAIGGGVPLGAMLCKASCDVFAPGDHATTYGGNPLACAAGLAVARAIDDDGLVENAAERGAQLKAGLDRLVVDYAELLAEARGRGLLLGLELKAPHKAADLVTLCADEGLLVVPAGPSVVRFVPPLVVSDVHVDTALDILETALARYRTSLRSSSAAAAAAAAAA